MKKLINHFRWYYNYSLMCFNKIKNDFKDIYKTLFSRGRISDRNLRDVINKISYNEMDKSISLNESQSIFIPSWMDDFHNRIPRGAIKQLAQNINSARSNLKNKNIDSYYLHFKKRKSTSGECLFEDSLFPSWIKKIKGYVNTTSGMIIFHDKVKNKYYLKIGEEIRRERFYFEKQDVISLDPGIRTFQTGYSPNGHIIEFGKNCKEKLEVHFKRIDYYKSQYDKTKFERYRSKMLREWRKIRDKVDDLHWKTIRVLTSHYDLILLPQFETSQMVRGSLYKKTKREMNFLSFYKFKSRLLWKSFLNGNTVRIVDESYTSKTCGSCGVINKKLGHSKFFNCPSCGLQIDRDVNGARNILLKNLITPTFNGETE